MMPLRLIVFLSFVSYIQASAISSATSYRRQSARNRTTRGAEATQQPCNGESTFQSPRKACKYYVWDLRSALLYRWCHHLLKDHVYEGRGGKKFVRFESNSILQLLYPCSRYAPNRCLVCGGSFSDHLELWWSKHLYTPWDLCMDRTYKEGEVIMEEDTTKSRRGRNKQTSPLIVSPPRYAFHKQYVQDVSDLMKGATTLQEQKKLLKDKLESSRKGDKKKALVQQRLTRFPEYGVAYLTPQKPKENPSRKGKRSSFTLEFARALCLLRLEGLVADQEYENAVLKNAI
ncbi:unnamed protein product [Cylindrotheca closterium]|uniref:Uncharacterized protein n=1 Tax=Cylindrotheca closterium TaxID=2856 RepID=A0AAD2PY05_9STRA|nr:unnamed protein product [Cylindrotheca closterium]